MTTVVTKFWILFYWVFQSRRICVRFELRCTISVISRRNKLIPIDEIIWNHLNHLKPSEVTWNISANSESFQIISGWFQMITSHSKRSFEIVGISLFLLALSFEQTGKRDCKSGFYLVQLTSTGHDFAEDLIAEIFLFQDTYVGWTAVHELNYNRIETKNPSRSMRHPCKKFWWKLRLKSIIWLKIEF